MKAINKIFERLTKTRLRKILASTLAILILITSIRYLFLEPKEVNATITEVTASSNQTLSSTSYASVDSMSVTPGAGSYLAVFTMEVLYDATAGTNELYVSLFVNGSQQTHTERVLGSDGSLDSMVWTTMTHAYITVGAGQTVEAQYKISTGVSFTGRNRSLTLYPVNPSNVTQLTDTADDTLNSASYTRLDNMFIAPGAGEYLLVFSTSANSSAGTSPTTTDMFFAVHNNDTISQHTERTFDYDGSFVGVDFPVLIAAKLSLTGGETIDIKWKNSQTTTLTAHQRTLTLIKVSSGQLYEASSTSDDSSTGTSDATITGMTLTPGAGTYLALFSGSTTYGTEGTNRTTFYSFYENTVQKADTEKEFMHEGSIDATNDLGVYISGKVDIGSSQNLEVKWRGDTASSRTIRERTFILLKDPATPIYLGFNEGYGTTTSDTNSWVGAGTITNAIWKTEEYCKFQKCIYFDGTGDYVSFSDDSDFDAVTGEDITIEGWFRTPDITSGTRTLIAKEESTGTDGGYKIEINSSGFVVLGIDDNNTSFPSDSVTSTLAYDDNKWHHFAAVKDGSSSLTLYIDGVSVGTPDASPAADIGNNDNFYVGIYDGSSNGFSGFLDEVKVYRSARSASEIKADMAGQTPLRGTSASFGPDNSFLSNGLVGYWKMDESSGTSVADVSGSGNTGTSSGTPTVGTGKYGNALTFDAIDDYVDAGSGSNVDQLSQLTASAWIYSDAVPAAAGRIIGKNGASTVQGWRFEQDNASSRLAFEVIGTTNMRRQTANNSIAQTQWQHVAVTWTGDITDYTSVKIYVNGTEVSYADGSSTNGSVRADDSGVNLCIGARCPSFLGGWDGLIDDVRLYNRVLSPAEIQKLYSAAPGPVGEWKMDENTGTSSTYDSSTNGSTGTLTGTMTANDWVPGKYGSALDFDGTDDRVNAGSATVLDDMSALSISAWIYPRSDGELNEGIIISKESGGDDGGWALTMTFNGGDDGIKFMVGRATTNLINYSTSGAITLNAWNHVGVVWDGTLAVANVDLYVNGINVSNDADGQAGSGTRDSDSAQSVYIGNDPAGTQSFDGYIDNVKLYNHARNSTQIIEDMNGGHPSPGSPVGSAAGYWKFDEGYGTTAYDGSTNANNLTLSTASWTNSGKFGKAWNGDGAVWLSLTDDANDEEAYDFAATDDFTISLWMKSDDTANPAGSEYVLSKAESSPGYRLYFSGSGNITFGIDEDATWTPQDTVSSVADVYDATWHHIVATKIGTSKIQLYIDGKLNSEDTSLAADTSLANAVNLYLGDRNGVNGGDEFFGDIDEVKIYRLALTPDEVKVEYNRGSAAVMGSLSTDSSGVGSFSNENIYCRPRSSGTCTPPVAEWKMDENTGTTLNDSSGNAYTSTTWTGNTVFRPGYLGSGLLFDGIDDVVRIAPTASSYLDTIGAVGNSYSVSAWFKTINTDTGLVQNIVAKDKDNTGVFPFKLYIAANPKEISFHINDGSTCNINGSGINVNDGKWHHATGIFNASAGFTYVYLDGVLVGTSTSCGTNSSSANTDDISIGNARNAAAVDYVLDDFDGTIDQVRIYNYVRSLTDIAWEYGHGKPTVAWWKLDDNVGDAGTVYDSTIWSKNGTTDNGANNTGMDCTVSGKRNRACDFDGTDDTISFGNQTFHSNAFVDGRDFSIAGWFNRDTFTTDDTIVGKKPDQSISEGWIIWIDNNGSTDKLTFVGADATDTYTVESASTFDASGWNHFVFTWDDDDANNINFYINGVAETVTKTGTLANIGDMDGTGRNLRIGTDHSGTGNPFDGKIDDIMIFGHTLNSYEVKNIYNQAGAVRFGPESGTP